MLSKNDFEKSISILFVTDTQIFYPLYINEPQISARLWLKDSEEIAYALYMAIHANAQCMFSRYTNYASPFLNSFLESALKYSMLKIGLTGGIGSGKTTVSKIFTILGIPVFNADDVAKTIMNEDVDLKQSIINLFGEEAYITNTLNRKYIAGIVFNNRFKLEQLNALVHPVTIAAAEKWLNTQTTPYAIKEAALMFEAGAAAHLDCIIGVYAPQHLRLQRVMRRDAANREAILERMNNQIDETIKMKLCDFVVVNDEQNAVLPQVLALHKKFISSPS